MFVRRIAAALAFASLATASLAESTVVGRVRVAPAESEQSLKLEALRETFGAQVESAGRETRNFSRLVRLQPMPDGSFVAKYYDYGAQAAMRVRLDESGAELGREKIASMPFVGEREWSEALEILRADAHFAAALRGGDDAIFRPMPPVGTGPAGERLIHIGAYLGPDDTGVQRTEIASIDIASGKVTRYAASAPPAAKAGRGSCGPPSSGCSAGSPSGSGTASIEWPEANPVWKFKVTRPENSTGEDGSGVELTDVYYKDRLVLKRAHMPVLNVQYENNGCGPFRDWMTSTNCFRAFGTAVAPGILVTNGTAPGTICELDVDDGNFRGVAIHDEGDALWLMSEMDAGWYRYIVEWRLTLEGTIEPLIGFSATRNGCVCVNHHHHGYWRFELAVDGQPNDFATGFVKVARRNPDGAWENVVSERKNTRPARQPQTDWWRFTNPDTGTAWVLSPHAREDSSAGVPYAKGDYWVLAHSASQVNDTGSTDTSINIDPWLNGEELGKDKRVVFWHRTGYVHDVQENPNEICEIIGPVLRIASSPQDPNAKTTFSVQ